MVAKCKVKCSNWNVHNEWLLLFLCFICLQNDHIRQLHEGDSYIICAQACTKLTQIVAKSSAASDQFSLERQVIVLSCDPLWNCKVEAEALNTQVRRLIYMDRKSDMVFTQVWMSQQSRVCSFMWSESIPCGILQLLNWMLLIYWLAGRLHW